MLFRSNPPKQQTKVSTKKVWVPKGKKSSNASTRPPQRPNATEHWIPKSQASSSNTKCANTAPKPYPQQEPRQSFRASTQSHWIPKFTLHAQGYYDGQRQIWLPKRPNPSSKPRTSSKPTSPMENSPIKATPNPSQKPLRQVWLPKRQQPKSPTIKYRAQLLHRIF